METSSTGDALIALTPTQSDIWVACQADPDAPVYRAAECGEIEGVLDRDVFERALERTVLEFDALRARFVETPQGPRQSITSEAPRGAEWIDLRSHADPRAAADDWIREDLARPIDLGSGRLYTFAVFRVAESTYLWYQGYHHIVIDGVSFALFNKRFGEVYNALAEGSGIPDSDVRSVRSLVADHQEYEKSGQFTQDREYWRDRFADTPELGRLAGEPPAGWAVPVRRRATLPPWIVEALRDARARQGIRTSRLMFAAAAVLVHRQSGSPDVVLSLPVTARTTKRAQSAAGPLVNVLPLRISVRRHTPVRELLEHVDAEIRAALAHQRYPGELLRRELAAHGMRGSALGPAVNVIPFRYGGRFGEARLVTSRNMSVRHIHDMNFSAYLRSDDGMDVDLDADPRLFTEGEAAGLHEAFIQLLGEIAGTSGETGVRVADLSTVSEERRAVLRDWAGAKSSDVPAATVPELFRKVAERHPRAAAVETAGAPPVSYAELDRRSEALAALLRARGVGAESVVAVALPRTPELVVAMLAVMRAGGAYLPVDPAYPRQRVADMLADARPRCLITDSATSGTLGTAGLRTVLVDEPTASAGPAHPSPLADAGAAPALDVRSTAYVIYTSGSTGRPKGVAVTHAGVGELVRAQQRAFCAGPGARVLQFASMSFDAAFWETAMALLSGGTLVLPGNAEELTPPELGPLIARQRITHLTIPPAALSVLPEGAVPDGTTVIVAGEACPPELAATWAPGRTMVNAYGPTETTVCCTASGPLDGTDSPVPVGKPFAASGIHVLDKALRQVQPGVTGEVYVTGPGLARGYLGRPGTTAERFVASPFAGAGERMYRTGDLARWRADGSLEFISRVDDQVKIRGFRVELGEIESVLLAQEGIRQAVAVLRADGGREPGIVAYVVADGPGPLDLDAVGRELAAHLPAPMRPQDIVVLDALPITPQGKVDRRALPAPAAPGAAGPGGDRAAAPRTRLERQLCALFAEVLGVETAAVGTDRSFFDLGGHSLLAGRLVMRVRTELGAPCGMETLFTTPTVGGLAEHLGDGWGGPAAGYDPVREGPVPVPREDEDGAELSFAQRGLWLTHRLVGPSAAYNIPLALMVEGELDEDALAEALNDVVDRHEILRTRYEEREGVPTQHILAVGAARQRLITETIGAGGLAPGLAAAAASPFDLAAGPPLRAVLFTQGPRRHVLLLTVHHIAADAESLRPLMRDLLAAYEARRSGRAPDLADLPVQYADYASWQRRALGDEADPDSALARQTIFWERQLAGLPADIELPFDRPHPASPAAAPSAVARAVVEPGLHRRLVELGRSTAASTFMTLQAALAALLTRHGAGEDIALGVPVAGRDHPALDEMVGLFTNTLVLRTDTSGNPPFRTLLRRVVAGNTAAYACQDLPFERLVEVLKPPRSVSRHPLFQVMLSMDSSRRALPSVPGLELDLREVPTGAAKFDLSFNVRETFAAGGGAAGIALSLEYRTDVFEASTAQALLERYVRLLDAVTQDPDVPVGAAGMLAADEYRQLVRGGNGTDAPELPHDVVTRIRSMAAGRPDAVAVTDDSGAVTYRELLELVDRVARRLRAQGVGPDTVVGVLADRGRWAVASFLGILASGAAYLPLETGAPAGRSASLLSDAGGRCLLAGPGYADLAAAVVETAGREVPVLDPAAGEADGAGLPRGPVPAPLPGHLAYVIYTSGSTGRPKGAMVHHAGMNNHLLAKVEDLGLTDGDTVVLNAPLTFDISLWQMVCPLLVGGRVLAAGSALAADPGRLFQRAADDGVTVLEVVPSLLRAALEVWDDGGQLPLLPELRFLVVTGEELPGELCRRWLARYPAIPLVNAYGPTECSDDVTHAFIEQPPSRVTAPIGRAVRNTRLYVLSDELQPVPQGVAGDLYVAGVGVGRGYLGDPAKTAGMFVADPIANDGSVAYRTGDRVRRLADGQLEFLGRRDTQVKIRGRRIELGEVEAELRAQPGVSDAVASVVPGPGGHPRLVGYVVGGPGAEAVQAALAAALPEHLVPHAVVALDAVPLTPNGKTDRKALPVPASHTMVSREPRTWQEEILCGVFGEVLGLDKVGANDDFFELGGHSLLATRLVSRLRKVLGAEVPLATLFEAPTAAALARRLRDAGPARAGLVRHRRPDVLPLSPGQHRLWFMQQLRPDSTEYHVPVVLDIEGPLDPDALAAALDDVVDRHEILRTRYPADGGEPRQQVLPALRGLLETQEATAADRAGLVRECVDRPFVLAAEPPLRARLLCTPHGRTPHDGIHTLVLVTHHIALDGWSLDILLRDLSAAYRVRCAGDAPGWKPLPVQYADHALTQRHRLQDSGGDGEAWSGQLDFWRAALADLPGEVTLPPDRPRPALPELTADVVPFALGAEVWQGVQVLARARGASVFMVLHAALTAVLARLGAGTDTPIGTVVAGRDDELLDNVVGFFVNTVTLRVSAAGNPSFEELLERVRAADLGAFGHQEVPFDQVVEEVNPARSPSHHPLFQVMLTLQNTPEEQPDLAGTTVRRRFVRLERAKFDLSFMLRTGEDGLTGGVEYATELYDRSTVESLVAMLQHVLAAVSADPGIRLGDARLLKDAEPADGTGSGVSAGHAFGPVREVPYRTVVEGFGAQVARTPGAVAVSASDGTLTYGELDARTDRVAAALAARGAGPERFVAILLPPGAAQIVAVLAVLKSGAGYLPLDPGHPEARTASVVRDAAPVLAVTTAELAHRLAVPTLLLDQDPPDATSPLPAPPRPGHPAYVIHTSGSTGRPKGVVVEHSALADYVAWAAQSYPGAAGRTLLHSPLTFDMPVTTLFAPLVSGGSIEVGELDPGRTSDRGYDLLKLTPTHLAVLGSAGPRFANRGCDLVVGGEPLPAELAGIWLSATEGLTVHNEYGPTEATVGCVLHSVARAAQLPSGSLPIGKPSANTSVRVLDSWLNPVPAGVTGELYVCGTGLARGYLGAAGATAERFVADPWAPGRRMYRTGDLVRWTAGGRLTFHGRADDQVKIRGFRVEPGEVESVLRSHPSVSRAAVIPREQDLVAYVCPAGAPRDELRAWAARHLPAHAVPSVVVVLPELPVTSSGKLDRRALPAVSVRGSGSEVRGTVEETLAGVFGEVLGAERVGAEDDFFALGGHSLSVMRLVNRIRTVLGSEVSVRSVFEHPTVRSLAGVLAGAGEARPALLRRPRPPRVPLSPGQRRTWFIHRLNPRDVTYNVPLHLDLHGTVDRAALRAALADVVQRHEPLRTVLLEDGGEPWQQVLSQEAALPKIVLKDVAPEDLDAETDRARRHAFDLAAEPPLRVWLLSTAPARHRLLLLCHHVAVDGLSFRPLLRDLDQAYRARCEGRAPRWEPLAVEYADYALWQRELLDREGESDEAGVGVTFWTSALAGLPDELLLPVDRPRPAEPGFHAGTVPFTVDAELWDGVRALARRSGASAFMVLHAAVAALLSRLGAGDDVAVGTPVAGRADEVLDDVVGFFVNTLVLRVSTAGNPSFAELVRRARESDLAAFTHQDVPFEQVVDAVNPARSLSRHPLFQVMVTLQDASEPEAEFGDLEVTRHAPDTSAAKVDLAFGFADTGGDCQGAVQYSTDLFDRSTAEGLTAMLQRLLRAVVADPGRGVADVDVLGPEGRSLLHRLGDGPRNEVPPRSLTRAFASRADLTPDAVAVTGGGIALTYRQLDERAEALADRLAELGVTAEARVAVLMERSAELVVAVLAVLKAGGAYVPLDPQEVPARAGRLLRQAGAVLVLTQEQLRDHGVIRECDVPVVFAGSAGTAAAPRRRRPRRPGQLAYVMYTSGSTGEPKGVAVTDNSVVSLAADRHWSSGHAAATLMQTSVSFDPSTFELWVPLLTGGRIVVAPWQRHPQPHLLAHTVAEHGVTGAALPAAVFEALAAADPSCFRGLREIWTGGESMSPTATARVRESAPDLVLTNSYGPTETTFAVVQHRGADSGGARVPIGEPMDNVRCHVLDDRLRPVPVGVPGELYVAGPGTARGYLDRPGGSAERFVADPFSADGGRMYRTGDLVRYRSDGKLEFLTRTDQQVKVRGHRVETGEIEAALNSCPGVARAAVVLRADRPGAPALVGYVVPAPGRNPSPEGLRTRLAELLPAHMVPADVVELAELPLSRHGKLDHDALPAPSRSTRSRAVRPARDRTERVLCAAVADLLKQEEVGVDDNFFELGGDSILFIQLVTRVRSEGLLLSVRDVFTHQTVAELARAARPVTGRTAQEGEDRETGVLPATPIMHWLRELGGPIEAFNQSMTVRVPASVDRARLTEALRTLLATHAMLRARLRPDWTLEVPETGMPADEALLRRVDATTGDDEAAEGAAAAGRLDPWNGVMLQAVWFDAGPARPGRLLLVAHHLVVDGVSWRILLPDLAAAARAAAGDRTAELPPVTTSFRGWAGRLAEAAQDPRLRDELPWWRRTLEGVPALLSEEAPAPGRDTFDRLGRLRTTVATELTAAVLEEAGAALNLRTEEILLTALALAAGERRRKRRLPGHGVLVDLESHGRDPGDLADAPDVSRTVGWFTRMHPVRIDAGAVPREQWRGGGEAVERAARRVKEQLRGCPDGGAGYGLLRYAGSPEDGQQLGRSTAEVGFNYLGRFQVSDDADWLAAADQVPVPAADAGMRVPHALELTVVCADLPAGPEFTVTWSWAQGLVAEREIAELADLWHAALEALCTRAREGARPGHTPSDVPLVSLNQEELDQLEENWSF